MSGPQEPRLKLFAALYWITMWRIETPAPIVAAMSDQTRPQPAGSAWRSEQCQHGQKAACDYAQALKDKQRAGGASSLNCRVIAKATLPQQNKACIRKPMRYRPD